VVKLQASDGKSSSYATVTVNVTDAYTQIPNLKGQDDFHVLGSKYGLNPVTGGCSASGMKESVIYTTVPHAGSIVAYGSRVNVWYVNNEQFDRACGGL
jgi:hypothetical protein